MRTPISIINEKIKKVDVINLTMTHLPEEIDKFVIFGFLFLSLLKEVGYNTYAEVTDSLIPDTCLFTDFDYYSYMPKEDNVYTP